MKKLKPQGTVSGNDFLLTPQHHFLQASLPRAEGSGQDCVLLSLVSLRESMPGPADEGNATWGFVPGKGSHPQGSRLWGETGKDLTIKHTLLYWRKCLQRWWKPVSEKKLGFCVSLLLLPWGTEFRAVTLKGVGSSIFVSIFHRESGKNPLRHFCVQSSLCPYVAHKSLFFCFREKPSSKDIGAWEFSHSTHGVLQPGHVHLEK